MPTIIGADQLQRVVLQPGNSVARYQGGVAEGAAAQAAQAEGQASASVAHAIGGLANRVTDIATTERDRLETIKVGDAITKNRQRTLALVSAYGDTRGGDVMAAGYLDKRIAAYDAQSNDVATMLTTDRQREAFKRASDADRVGYSSGLMNHVFSETDKYEDLVTKASLETDIASVASQYQDQKAITNSIANTARMVEVTLDRQGILDPNARTLAMQQRIGTLHATVVDTALENQDPKYAMGYLQTNKDAMTPDQIRAASAHVKPAIEYANAVEMADQAEQMRVSGKSPAEINKYLTHQATGREELGLVKSLVAAKAQELKDQSDNDVGGMYKQFYDQKATMASALAIRRSPAFGKLSQEDQGKVYEHLFQQGRLTGDKAKEAKDWNSMEANALYYPLATDPKLKDKTPEQLYLMADKIGPARVEKLLAQRKDQLAGVVAFKLNTKILNDAIPEALRSPSNDKEKQQLAAFKGVAEEALQQFKTDNTRTPSLDEQRVIVRTAQQTVTRERWWGVLPDKQVPVYELPEKERQGVLDSRRLISLPKDKWKAAVLGAAEARGQAVSAAQLEFKWNQFNKGR